MKLINMLFTGKSGRYLYQQDTVSNPWKTSIILIQKPVLIQTLEKLRSRESYWKLIPDDWKKIASRRKAGGFFILNPSGY